MNKINLLFLLNILSISAFSQQLEPTQQDIETYKKLERGGFSNEFYLKAIIEKKITDSSVEELERKIGYDMNDMYCQGLIQSLINKNHKGKYYSKGYFESLKFEKFNDQFYFYENAGLNDDNELFIWGTYGSKDEEITIHSAVGHNLEPDSYETTFRTINDNDFIIFEADEQVAIVPMAIDTAITLTYSVDEFEKIGTYRKCNLSCDTCINCVRLQHKGTSAQVLKEERIFTTELIFDDLDKNGNLDCYWFALSNGELVKYEAFTPIDNKLIPITTELEKLIKQTSRFDELKKISLLSNKPGL